MALAFEQSESRNISNGSLENKNNEITGTRIIKVSRDFKPQNELSIPNLGATWPETEIEIFYTHYSLQKGGQYDVYTYFYSKIKAGYTRLTFKGAVESISIQKRKGYRTAWEYVLATFIDANVSSGVPDWYATSTNTLSPDPDYKWFLSPSSIPSSDTGAGWKMVDGGDALWKNGLRTFRKHNPVVSETKYYADVAVADQNALFVDILLKPIDYEGRLQAAGLKTDDKHWLVTSTNQSIEGAYHVVTMIHEYKEYLDKNDVSQGWDEDIYDFIA